MEAVYTYKSNWWGYIGKRVLIAVVAFIVISLMVFFIMYEEPFVDIFFTGTITNEIRENIYQVLGVDTSPVIVKYFRWIGDFFTGDLGQSLFGSSYYLK